MDGTNSLETMSWSDLIKLRNEYPSGHPMQAVIGPYEHRAYAREFGSLEPFRTAIGIPGHTILKGLGLVGGRSPASLSEIYQGYKGLGEAFKP